MERFNFTQATIDALPRPEPGQRARYYDTKELSLTLRVSPTGAKVFYFYKWWKGAAKQIKLGTHPHMSVPIARERAREYEVRLDRGDDPVAKKREEAAEPRLKDLFTWYLEGYAKPRKRSWRQDVYRWKYLLRLADSKLSAITRSQVMDLQTRLAKDHGQATANNAISLLSGMWKRALDAEYTAVPSPCQRMSYYKLESRERRLQPDEIVRFFATVDRWWNADIRHIVLLALYTGQRKTDVLGMRWADVDLAGGRWTIPRTKSGVPHVVPLEPEEVAILQERHRVATGSPWVFPSHSGEGHLSRIEASWKSLTEQAGVPDLRFHDLRRSLGSWMADTGASLPVIGKALAHTSTSATAVYARLHLDPVREAKTRAIQAMRKAKR
jgi:integrase